MTMQTHNSKPMGWSKRSSKSKVYSNTILPQETNKQKTKQNKKTLNRQCNFTSKTTGKRRKKIIRRKEIIKIQAEINEKEMKSNNKD